MFVGYNVIDVSVNYKHTPAWFDLIEISCLKIAQ